MNVIFLSLSPLTLVLSFGQLLLGNVEIVHIGGVVFGMMQLHNLSRDDRFQRIVVVGKVGQSVFATRVDQNGGSGKTSE